MTDTWSSPAYTRFHWAKADRQDHRRIHLLEHHLADVGASFEALLAQPTIRQRLARSGGLDSLDDATAARLALFAAFHDIGKVNTGFQTRIWESQYLQNKPRIRNAGHSLDLAPVLSGEDRTTSEWFFEALGWWDEAVASWDDCDGETVCALFVATLSHHGLPLQLEGKRFANPAVWRSFGDLNPAQCVRRIGGLARQWFPDAFTAGAAALPSAPAFQHMFLGLCTLSDWIGSNEAWFPYCAEPDNDYMNKARRKAKWAVRQIGLDLSKQRVSLPCGPPSFAQLFGFDSGPNAIQQATIDTPADERLVIVESETGSGKTEAAFWRFARMYRAKLVDGIYFALPTRSAASQIFRRLQCFTVRLFPAPHRPPVLLAVPGYLRDGDATGHLLQNYEVWWDDHPDDATRGRRWAAENSKRYLAAQIAVGTVDQAMMAALKVKHAHMRAACLARNLLVVDEVHASDTYMRRILKSLLDAHLDAGGYALLMSATLGSAARRQWLATARPHTNDVLPLDEAINSPYPAVSISTPVGESMNAVGENDREKTVHIDVTALMRDFDGVAERALQAARAGARVLVIRNTVDYAIRTQQSVERAASDLDSGVLFSCENAPTLHHGRFAGDDRRMLDRSVEERLGKGCTGGGVVVAGTQTLEQSLDIDADLLITDLCPVDVMLQRIGRLHRHRRDDRPSGYATPVCVVLTPEGGDLSPLLQSGLDRNGLGPHGYVYEDLRILEATRRLAIEHPNWSIPRMNRYLVERATHPAALETIVQKLGDDWRVHANRVMGDEIAEGLTASSVIVRRDKSFYADNHDVLFGSAEERIRTRLGDEGIEVKLDPPPVSPFDPDRTIDRMELPLRWLGNLDAPDSVKPSPTNGGFTFGIGDRVFRYDRLGLRRET